MYRRFQTPRNHHGRVRSPDTLSWLGSRWKVIVATFTLTRTAATGLLVYLTRIATSYRGDSPHVRNSDDEDSPHN